MAKEDIVTFFEKGVSYMNDYHHPRTMIDAAVYYLNEFKRDREKTLIINAEQSLNRATESFLHMVKIYAEIYGSPSSLEGGGKF